MAKRKSKEPEMTAGPDEVENDPRPLDQMPLSEALALLDLTEDEFGVLTDQGFLLYDELMCANSEMMTPHRFAREVQCTTRQLRNLEEKGLPSVGQFKKKRYPWPLAEHWFWIWRMRTEHYRGTSHGLGWLDAREANAAFEDEMALVRAWNHVRSGQTHPLDAASAARLEDAKRLILRGVWPRIYQVRGFREAWWG